MSEDRDLEARVAELEAAVTELQDSRGGGRPRTGIDRFLDVAVPMGLVAVEAQLRTLETVVDAMDRRTGQIDSAAVREASEDTLEELETTLDRLEHELETGDVPGGREAATVLGEIRELQATVQNRLDQRRSPPGDREQGVRIDVESELETIKDEVEGEDDG